MADDRMALVELIEQGADSDLVRKMLAFAAERMMDLEIEARTGVPWGPLSLDRLNHRIRYRKRGWDTRAGRIELAIPKLRKGSYFPSFRATSYCGEGLGGSDPGSLRPRCLDSFARRPMHRVATHIQSCINRHRSSSCIEAPRQLRTMPEGG